VRHGGPVSDDAATVPCHHGHVIERHFIVEWHRAGDVLYLEYTPLTVEYDPGLDAFTVARADIHPPERRHGLTLAVVATSRQITVEHLLLDAAIAQGRSLLARLVEEHRGLADQLTADGSYIFDLGGQRLR
jgi:hypothetical protein